MKALALALVLVFTGACASLPSITPQDAHNAITAAQNGLAHVSPLVDEACSDSARPVYAYCPALKADLAAAGGALQALQAAVDAGEATSSEDLFLAAERLGASLRALALEVQVTRAASSGDGGV